MKISIIQKKKILSPAIESRLFLCGNLKLTAQSQQEIYLQNYRIAKASENEAYFFQICQWEKLSKNMKRLATILNAIGAKLINYQSPFSGLSILLSLATAAFQRSSQSFTVSQKKIQCIRLLKTTLCIPHIQICIYIKSFRWILFSRNFLYRLKSFYKFHEIFHIFNTFLKIYTLSFVANVFVFIFFQLKIVSNFRLISRRLNLIVTILHCSLHSQEKVLLTRDET